MKRSGILTIAVLGLAACNTMPNDVTPRQQAMDQRNQELRQNSLVLGTQQSQPSATPTTRISTFPPEGANDPVNDGGDVNAITSAAADAILAAEANAPSQGGVFDNIQPQMASDVLPAPLIPRVAAFALRTTHLPGQRQWRRNPLRGPSSVSCSVFPHPDIAQDRFLAEGGPERDRFRLDPDGDGFVCGFDPRAIRAEAAANRAPPNPNDAPLPQVIDPAG